MNATITKLIVLAVAGLLYVGGVFFPDLHDPLTALAGMATGLLLPQIGKAKVPA